ncbi:MAG TPA: excinuclease ABC subunit UvrC [Thermoanaerobaculia bacterium]|nr:excinuclease ABC subunit UvrC [Thermoanaerobaculia bacterium]
MSDQHDHLAQRIRELPDSPGIYIFKDAGGKVLYVGKAKSLRKRASSYLTKDHEPRLAAMVAEAADLEFVVTDSETEALLIENNWIKRKRPRYNILLRDDKTYPYLKLTLQDEFPRIAFTRRIRDDGGEYFGPFLPGGLARKAIKLVQKLFQIRVCRIEIDGSLPRPCLYYDMHRCLGPCSAGLTTKIAYDEAVRQARLFLTGRNEQLSKQLKRDMWEAAEAMDYERAAKVRDTLAEVEAISQRRKLSSVEDEDLDVYGFHISGGNAAVAALVMRGGQVLDRRELFWEAVGQITPELLLSEVLPQIYDRTTFIPKEVHLPVAIDGEEALVEWLSEKKGERVYLRMPSRGPKAERVALAMHNAELAHKRRFRGAKISPGASALERHLGLEEPPARIEGFDISHFQGGETVASMVVWEEGRMRKSDYRSFNIRDIRQPDDFASMRQAVERRYRRVLEETGSMPDLILIDGGRGQLNAALAALTELGVEETSVVSLAKREEEIYMPEAPVPLRLGRDDAGLRLLQEIRDEAHRFAVARHRARRSARTLHSKLDELAGVGPRRRKLLIQTFGSVQGVRDASVDDLQKALGPSMGRRIFEQLHRAETAEPGGLQ